VWEHGKLGEEEKKTGGGRERKFQEGEQKGAAMAKKSKRWCKRKGKRVREIRQVGGLKGKKGEDSRKVI